MPKFNCSYAHDIPAYADFVVEAADEAEAQKIIEQALKDGKFDNVYPDPCWDMAGESRRVFTSGEVGECDVSHYQTLDELIAEANEI